MHLSPETALDLIEERLTDHQEEFWLRHLELCMECTAEIGRWRELKTGLRRSHLSSAPQESVKSAVQIISSQPVESGRLSPARAEIIFDSFLQPAFAGVRGGSAAARQLVMRAEEFDIHIKIWGEPERRQMLGQLL